MKSLFSMLIIAAALAPSAFADEACSANVQQSVQRKAMTDYPGQSVIADFPNTSEVDGGQMVTIQVPVRVNGQIVATYSTMVGETCQVMSVYR